MSAWCGVLIQILLVGKTHVLSLSEEDGERGGGGGGTKKSQDGHKPFSVVL